MARNKSEKELREEAEVKESDRFAYNVNYDHQWIMQQLGVTPQWSANDRSYRGPQSV